MGNQQKPPQVCISDTSPLDRQTNVNYFPDGEDELGEPKMYKRKELRFKDLSEPETDF